MLSANTPLAAEAAFVAPAVLDIEASGFGRNSYPVEIGYVLSDGRSYCSLIRPAPDWTHWDPEAERLHRIPRPIAIKHGRDVREVAAHLNDELRGLTLYCDGWVHDYTWVAVLFDAAGLSPSFKLDNLRALMTDREAGVWSVLKQQVATEMRLQRHRASTDAKILQSTLIRLRSPLPSPPG